MSNARDYIKWDAEGNLEFSTKGNNMYPLLSTIIRAAQEENEKQDDDSWCKELLSACQAVVLIKYKKW